MTKFKNWITTAGVKAVIAPKYSDNELDSFVKSGDITEAEKQNILEGK